MISTHQIPKHRRPTRRSICTAVPILLRITQALPNRNRTSQPKHCHAIQYIRRQVVDHPVDVVTDLNKFRWVGAVDGVKLTVDEVLGFLNCCRVAVEVV